MDLERLNQWLLLVSQVGILAGLLLVGLQMRQTTELTRVQLFSEITSSRIEMAGGYLGENPAPTIAKSLSDPDALTIAELYVMDAYLIRGLNEVRRSVVLKQLDLDVGISDTENIHAFYFGNEFAQKWWAVFMQMHAGDDVLGEVDTLIRSTRPNLTMDIFERQRAFDTSDPR